MQHHRYFVYLRTVIVALVMLALVPAQLMMAAQTTSNSFESTLGYTVTWGDEWDFDDSLMFEVEGTFDIITLWNQASGFVMISGQSGFTGVPGSMLEADEDEEIISSDLEGEVPQMITEDESFRTIEEAYVIDDGDIGITVGLTTTPMSFDSALADAQSGIVINGSPVLSGASLADSGTATDLTGVTETEAATEQTSTGITRTQRGGSTDTPAATEESGNGVTRTTRNANTETAEATEESGNGITRTTRGSSTETPEATEEASTETPEPTSDTSGLLTTGLETFVGPVYGYSFDYDDDIWTSGTTHEDEGTDGISMTSATSTLTIWAWDGYAADPLACLDGEASFYATESDRISDWEQVTDADGEPLRGEDGDIVWGVYSLMYENDRGNQTALIDYISCQPIPGEDAVLIVLLSSAPENYNDNLDLTFDILDTLEFAAAGTSTDPVPTEEVSTPDDGSAAADDRTEIDTNFDGSQYTSPLYGFTVYVPLEWQIESESVEGTDETLVLDNGTSVVTLWATPTPVGDLSACVDYAAQSSGLDLKLMQNSTGGDFRGDYGDEAFGNFSYSDGGTQMMYFIACKPIPRSDAVLILTQDVPFDQFTSERRLRNEIEESITMP